MDKHTFGLNDSEMWLTYLIYCAVVVAICFITQFALGTLKIKAPAPAAKVLSIVGGLGFIGILFCFVMYAIEKWIR